MTGPQGYASDPGYAGHPGPSPTAPSAPGSADSAGSAKESSGPDAARPRIADSYGTRPVHATDIAYRGMIWQVRRDAVELAPGVVVNREYVPHGGAVAVMALRPAAGGGEEVLMISQYRHAAGATMWELPAGLLDVAGEAPPAAAARELAEEVDLVADRWWVLADAVASPGSFPENLRIYLARDLAATPTRHERTAEEADLHPTWVPLDEAIDAVLAGRIHNPGAVIGLLAADAARRRDWSTLRAADCPWPAHPAYRDQAG